MRKFSSRTWYLVFCIIIIIMCRYPKHRHVCVIVRDRPPTHDVFVLGFLDTCTCSVSSINGFV